MTESDKAVMQQALDALPDMVELSNPMDERAVYGYTAEQMQAYARAAIAQPVQQTMHTQTDQVLREALKKLMGHVGNIEMLGEWSALEINASKAEVLRCQVIAVVNECEAAINPTGETK